MAEHHKFKDGEVNNPTGKHAPRGYSVTALMKHVLETEPEKRAKLVKSIFNKAVKGDVSAQKLVWNYMDGMPEQKSDITTNGKPLQFIRLDTREE